MDGITSPVASMDGITPSHAASNPTPIRSPALTQKFLDSLRLENGASPNTIKSYRADLCQFGRFLAGAIGARNQDQRLFNENLDQDLLGCTPLAAGEFQAYLFAQNYCKASIARKLATLKGFYKFLLRRGILLVNPLSTIRPPKQSRREPKYLDPDQIRKLLDAPGHGNLQSVRDSAILEFLYSSGIRVSEMLALRITDVDVSAGTVHICGPSPVNRVVPVDALAIVALQRYISMRPAQGKPGQELGDWVFLNKYGAPLGARSVRRILGKYLAVAGLSADLSPRTLRHSFAIHLLDQGADAHRMRELLGYRNLGTAQNYSRMSTRQQGGNRYAANDGAASSIAATAA